jgi:hypothetical protein
VPFYGVGRSSDGSYYAIGKNGHFVSFPWHDYLTPWGRFIRGFFFFANSAAFGIPAEITECKEEPVTTVEQISSFGGQMIANRAIGLLAAEVLNEIGLGSGQSLGPSSPGPVDTPSSGGSVTGTGGGLVPMGDSGAEFYYRAMSSTEAATLVATHELVGASGETFISPSLGYVLDGGYVGQVAELQFANGTTASLAAIGWANDANVLDHFPGMPLGAPTNWMYTAAQFKTEGDVINIGLGRAGGAALSIATTALLGFRFVR